MIAARSAGTCAARHSIRLTIVRALNDKSVCLSFDCYTIAATRHKNSFAPFLACNPLISADSAPEIARSGTKFWAFCARVAKLLRRVFRLLRGRGFATRGSLSGAQSLDRDQSRLRADGGGERFRRAGEGGRVAAPG